MDRNLFNLKPLFFLCQTLFTKTWNTHHLQRRPSNSHAAQSKISKYPFHATNAQELLSNHTLIFHVEGTLLKSSSVFPYFMLVAFEGGGPLRALILFLSYPFLCLLGQELRLKIMVFLCFVGIEEKSFKVGRAVLPKFFLEDVGFEGFNMVMTGGRTVGVTDLPRVMVDGFLRDYLGIKTVLGRGLKVVGGYFVGLMEENKTESAVLSEILEEEKRMDSHAVGIIGCFNKSVNQQLFSHFKAVYMVTEAEKRNWQALPREKYPKPLIFHDGRLAFRPTPLATLVMFMWIPFGILLFIFRAIVALLFPHKLSVPLLSFTGMTGTLSTPDSFSTQFNSEKPNGTLYVCNHKTLLDPIYISIIIERPLTAVTYSVSRVTELFSPIKTVPLTRNREKDSEMMEKLLSQGDLVVCPEGTTCREPYLLRFSPLFAELTDEIVPIAIDFKVSMFYGTTASGFKFLDPVFVLLNPTTTFSGKILGKLPESFTCAAGGKSKFEVANHVQAQIGKALEFECTNLTRKDKYQLLAGNEGFI